jgi:hypothetical protein
VNFREGKATRDITNFHQPAITETDYQGARTIIDNNYKLLIHDQKYGTIKRELFDLEADPAETLNLLNKLPEQAQKLEQQLKAWQSSVLHSLTAADY